MADNEDRRGEATRYVHLCGSLIGYPSHLIRRATAKKFLAAANFLELLKVFEKTDNAQVVSLERLLDIWDLFKYAL